MSRRLAIWALLLVSMVGTADALVGTKRALLSASSGNKVPNWVTPGALISCNYTLNQCWTPTAGISAAASSIATTRNTTSKCNGAAGVTSVGTNTPCLTSYGVCIYQATTNLALRSSAFTNAAWTTQNGATTDNAVVAPDGTTTASQYVENSSAGNHQIFQAITFAAVANTVSVYVKNGAANGRRYVFLSNISVGSVRQTVIFDTISGSVASTSKAGTPSSPTWSVTPQSVGNGWWRIWVQMTSNAGSGDIAIGGSNSATPSLDGNGTPTYTGDGVSNFYLWGPQVNAIGVPGPYVVTGASTASTSADVVTISSTALINALATGSSLINLKTANAQDALLSTLLGANGFDLIGKNSSGFAYTTNATGTLTATSVDTWQNANLTSLTQTPSGELLAVNGAAAGTNLTANTPAATFYLGSNSGTNQFINGCITQLEVLPATLNVGIAPNAVASATLDEWFVAGVGCLNAGVTACTNGQAVATWADQSGNGNTATACTAGPVYTTGAINSLPAMVFTKASSDCLTTSYTGPAATIIVVYESTTTNGQTSASGSDDIISGKPQAATTITAYDIYADTPNASNFHVRNFSYGTTNSSSAFSWQVLPARHKSVWQIAGMTQDGTTLTAYDFGSSVGTATIPGGATPYTATGQVIGASDLSGSLGNYFQGSIAEILVYHGKLSASDYAAVVQYEQQKYGLVPGGNYLMMAGNTAGGYYTDNNLYILNGGNGTNFPYTLATNYVPSVLAGQTTAVSLAPQLLHDMNGNLVKYNGRYWANDSRCAYNNGIVHPCVSADVLTSTDLINWTLAGTINCDQVLDGSSSTRGCFNDGWVIDAGNANAVYFLFNAANNEQNFACDQEYYVAMTLNANGTFSAGTPTAWAGSAFPVGSCATPNTGWFSESVVLLSGTYYAFLSNLSASFVLQWTTSTTGPFSGYNGSLTGVTIGGSAPSPDPQWPSWIQTGGGNGTMYLDKESNPYGHGIATDSAFGTVSGLSLGATMTFPGAFHPQQASVVKLPAVNLP